MDCEGEGKVREAMDAMKGDERENLGRETVGFGK